MAETDRANDAFAAASCTPEEALSVLRDLARDTKFMASALVRSLDALAENPPECRRARQDDALAQARDMAADLEEFLSWATEDPMTLTAELKAIMADQGAEP